MQIIQTKSLLGALFLALLVSIALAEIYQYTAKFIQPSWLAAAIVHSVLSIILLRFLLTKESTLPPKNKISFYFQSHKISPYLPGIILITLPILAVTLSSFFGNTQYSPIKIDQWAWVIWVSIIEEIVFRYGIGGFFRKKIGIFWGAYISIFIFSFVHSSPTIENILNAKVGLPLGPLLLGILCEVLYIHTGKLSSSILLHAAGNGSIIIFSIFDSRWLSWLQFFYQ